MSRFRSLIRSFSFWLSVSVLLCLMAWVERAVGDRLIMWTLWGMSCGAWVFAWARR